MYSPRKIVVLTLAVSAAVVLTVGAGSSLASRASADKTSLPGTWSGTYSGGYTGTFTLHWILNGSKLTGTITLSNPGGTFSINGSVHGKNINFGEVGAGATYSGKLSGKKMSGTYKAHRKRGVWSAKKTS